MPNIVRSVPRPSVALTKQIASFTPATLHEAQGRRGALDARIKPIYAGMRACGPAVTVSCHPGDNLMLIAAIAVATPGDVLVVSSSDHEAQGGFGEVLATACRARGIAGLVTDGGVRDGVALKELGFPAFCPGLCVKGTVKETLGEVNQPITIGGVWVRPGDLVCADDDGVVIVKPEEAAEVAARAQAREDKEAGFMKALRDGAELLELIGIDKVLAGKGCTYTG